MARFDDDEKKNKAEDVTEEKTVAEEITEENVKLIANGTYTDCAGEKYYAGDEMLVTRDEAKELLKIGLAYMPEQAEKKGRGRK